MRHAQDPANHHIVFVHPSDELYGADRVLIESLRAAPSRADAEVWLPSDVRYPKALLTRELAKINVPSRKLALPILRRALMRPRFVPRIIRDIAFASMRLLKMRPKVVYLNTSATLLLAPAARLAGSRVVLHLHEAWSPREAHILGALARCAHDVVCVSGDVRRRLPRGLRSRAIVVNNGIPIPDNVAATTPKVKLANGSMTFLVASRWNQWKGLDLLLHAWAAMPLKDNRRLVVLGGPPASGAAVNVPALVNSLDIQGSVEVVGEQENPWPWIIEADCIVVPSLSADPLPTIAIEAAAAGKAVIASNIGGLPEIVDDRVTGRLIAVGDTNAWADALASFTYEDARRLGDAARNRYEANFHPSIFASAMSALLWSEFPRA